LGPAEVFYGITCCVTHLYGRQCCAAFTSAQIKAENTFFPYSTMGLIKYYTYIFNKSVIR